MKKISSVILLILLTIFIIPVNTNAKTLKQLEDEVNKFTADLESKNNQIAANDAEVAEIKQKIADYENQISEIKSETAVLEQEIEESNIEIAEKVNKVNHYFNIFKLVKVKMLM